MAADTVPQDDGFPMVAAPTSGNTGLYVFLGILLVGGVGLFSALNANRLADEAPDALSVTPDPSARISSPPPVGIPPELLARGTMPEVPEEPPVMLQRVVPEQPAPVQVRQPVYVPVPAPARSTVEPVELAPRQLPPPVVAYRDTPASVLAAGQGSGSDQDRVRATRFESPGMTVPKGTVIAAVLETALDSTQPGGVRALVQRDVASFDGSRVLIPRGSRLIGEYEASLERGQNRAFITWTRLIRPDGVIITLDSPASDPLGRAGVKGMVDGKFLQRFGSALLQSVLDVGVGIATREASDGVIVALPGGSTTITPGRQAQDIQPTLKVKHGTSVSVFVARDLDFSSVGG
jgi:type IV secretion system protein VirB10